jgi:hypothetical protein
VPPEHAARLSIRWYRGPPVHPIRVGRDTLAVLLLGAGASACRPAAPSASAPEPMVSSPERSSAPEPAAAPTPTPWTIVELEGEGRDRDAVLRALASQPEGIHRCFADLPQRSPGATGVARIQFAIDPDGRVPIALMQHSTVGDRVFSHCLAEALTTIPFPDLYTGEVMSQTVVTCDFTVR